MPRDQRPPPEAVPSRFMHSRLAKALVGFGIVLVTVVALAAVAIWRFDAAPLVRDYLFKGEASELQPALFQSAPLRTSQGGRDLVYLLSTQSETVTSRRRGNQSGARREFLHVDLWAVDPATMQPAWRSRVHSFTGAGRINRDLRGIALLGVDGETLWVTADGPHAVSLADGSTVAHAATIEDRNPRLAGRRVDESGFVAFGRNGLQITLDDASQWRVDAASLQAAPRDTPLSRPGGVVPPAALANGSAWAFRMRGALIGDRWLGVLTDREADTYSKPPVVPGRAPDDRPGVMQDYLEARHVPPQLVDAEAVPYRLWTARVEQVSAAPRGWPADMPDNWGTRPRYSDYTMLPDAPAFLRAGLLREHPAGEHPLWYRNPDSILVLHVDRLGQAGRLQISRISGPAGTPVWQAALPFDRLEAVMRGEDDVVLLGVATPAAEASTRAQDVGPHIVLTGIDIPSGRNRVLDLTAESLRR